jgi:dipeptidyl-peptidase-4
LIHEESDEAWVDLFKIGNPRAIDYTNNFSFLKETNSILWASEKDGWRHLYQVSLEGKPEVLITKGEYDVIDLKHINSKEGYVYYLASPDNATQKYLYKTKLNGKGKNKLVSPESLKGSHEYSFSSNGTYAQHSFSNHFTPNTEEFITVANHKALTEEESVQVQVFLMHADEDDIVSESSVLDFVKQGMIGVVILLLVISVVWFKRKKRSVNYEIIKRQRRFS